MSNATASRSTARPSRALRGTAIAAAFPLLLVACSSNDSLETGKAADSVTINEQWIKAADSDMSAAFGELKNTSDQPHTVVAATSPASQRVELHEVVADANGNKTMRPKKGGFQIPANGSVQLRPGGDHIMFIGLNGPLRTGSETPVTLTFDDGSTNTFTAQVRDFPGNQENYTPDDAGAPHQPTPSHGG